jgi:hypothetical protein
MKIRNFLLLAITSAVMMSCIKKEFDTPPINIPAVDFESNTTIAQLKAMHPLPGVVDTIGSDIIIQGIVVANDESGNYYKTLIIQDTSAGLEIRIDKTSLYNDYKVGQRIYIKCKGLCLGDYGGLTQLGYNVNGVIQRIPETILTQHLFRDSLPGPAPQPITYNINELNNSAIHSTLVRINGITFQEPGVEFAPQGASGTDRKVEDGAGQTLVVRTSSYASFAGKFTPAGPGDIVGIIGNFNGTPQLTIRDLSDLKNFDPNLPVPVTLLNEAFNASPVGWTIFSAASDKDWLYSSTEKAMEANGYGGDIASDDWLITPALNLSGTYTARILTFSTWTQYTDNGTTTPIECKISTNYTGGNPGAATWTNLPATFPAYHSQTWTSSGNVDLQSYAGQTVYIAFRYVSSGTGSNSTSKWRLDNVKVLMTP